MKKQMVNDLNRRLLSNHLEKKSDLAGKEIRLPAQYFFDEKHFRVEKEALFMNVAQPVAFSSEIPAPNNFLALEVLNTPVLLTRDDKGSLRAFINACSHRGARVANGAGGNRRLICEFHGWSYALDGTLTGRPQDSCFSRINRKNWSQSKRCRFRPTHRRTKRFQS